MAAKTQQPLNCNSKLAGENDVDMQTVSRAACYPWCGFAVHEPRGLFVAIWIGCLCSLKCAFLLCCVCSISRTNVAVVRGSQGIHLLDPLDSHTPPQVLR